MRRNLYSTFYPSAARRRTLLLLFMLTASFWTCTVSDAATASNSPPIPSSGDADEDPGDNTLSLDVVEITSKNFATTIGDGNVWLIEFYTPWCSHCQTFKASYMSIAQAFHSSPKEKIRVARVDCSVEKALLSRFDVRGFPTFFVVAGWQVYQFDGARSEANLMTFARGGYKKQDVSILCCLCIVEWMFWVENVCRMAHDNCISPRYLSALLSLSLS